MVAVWALVKPRPSPFISAFAFIGAIVAGYASATTPTSLG